MVDHLSTLNEKEKEGVNLIEEFSDGDDRPQKSLFKVNNKGKR